MFVFLSWLLLLWAPELPLKGDAADASECAEHGSHHGSDGDSGADVEAMPAAADEPSAAELESLDHVADKDDAAKARTASKSIKPADLLASIKEISKEYKFTSVDDGALATEAGHQSSEHIEHVDRRMKRSEC